MSKNVCDLVAEYSIWLTENSNTRSIGSWQEITIPFLDHANDHFQFYSRLNNETLEFNDDGYTLNSLESAGFNFNGSRANRLDSIVKEFGASLENGTIYMKVNPINSADAMNRYVQTLLRVDSLIETISHRVATYFSEDVAQALDEQDIYYTQNISITGRSRFAHVFDFLFQQTNSTPTRFAQAPNKLDRPNMTTILFDWLDLKDAEQRKGAELLVFANDKEKPINSDIISGFAEYNVPIINFSEIPERAKLLLAT